MNMEGNEKEGKKDNEGGKELKAKEENEQRRE